MGKKTAPTKQGDGTKLIAGNKRARYEYFLSDNHEAGIQLTGTEVKSLREGKASLGEAWVKIDQRGEVWLMQAHIAEYAFGNRLNHQPTRPRKLLLHSDEIKRLSVATREQGITLVPLRIYLKNGLIKVEIAVGRGKNVADKRESLKQKQAKREIDRARKHNS